ncbi:MAG TPA: hypothetical protein VNI01_11830 [Elusimicrobiota bacterium]|nr:hypothetical protein [Elusimicrobiota bacterium]
MFDKLRRAVCEVPRWTLPARRTITLIERQGEGMRWRSAPAAPRRFFCALAALLLSWRSPACARAAFQETLESPRSAAMGGASLASRDDSTAMFLNPAAVARLKGGDLYFMYERFYAGLDGVGSLGQGFVSAAAPTRWGTLGLGFGDFRASGLLDEKTLSLTFARTVAGPLDLGVSLKRLSHSYLIGGDPLAAADPTFQNGASRSGVGLDGGLLLWLAPSFALGLALRNLNRPDLGLGVQDKVPRELQAGLAWDLPDSGLRLTADVTRREGVVGAALERCVPAMGVEKSFDEGRLRLRLGASSLQFSAGFGVQAGRFGIDYALVINRALAAGNAGTHLLGIRYGFGGKTLARERS